MMWNITMNTSSKWCRVLDNFYMFWNMPGLIFEFFIGEHFSLRLIKTRSYGHSRDGRFCASWMASPFHGSIYITSHRTHTLWFDISFRVRRRRSMVHRKLSWPFFTPFRKQFRFSLSIMSIGDMIYFTICYFWINKFFFRFLGR